MPLLSAEATECRRAARAEVERVNLVRAGQLAAMLRSGLSTEEIEQVRGWADRLAGILRDTWLVFIDTPVEVQLESLARPGCGDMPWHTLLQSNPYARLARWKPVALRPYA